jgi:DNA-binding transcriptional ArsR family regulator
MRNVDHSAEHGDVFHIVADATKRHILDLVREREWSVGELVMYFGLPQPAVSKHLRALREAHLVDVRVDGQRRWYRLRPESLRPVADWIDPYREVVNRRNSQPVENDARVMEFPIENTSRVG